MDKPTFIIWSKFGELLDVAIQLKQEKCEVFFYVSEKDYAEIGEGIVPKLKDWEWLDCLGKGYIWCIDGCDDGHFQDWLRAKGEFVFGGSKQGDRLENERQLGQDWFKKAGFYQPFSKNFKDIDSALKQVTDHPEIKYILKQNGGAPKSINHMGKFEGSEDMIYHLTELKKKWNEAEFGPVDFDLMEVVTGLEVAASVFFNGKDYMKNEKGKVVGYLNFEEKKESEKGMGVTCGEMGTTFIGTDEDNKLFKDILIHDKLLTVLRASKFRGVFDINAIQLKDGRIVALEPTMRFGIPGTSYEFIEGLDMPTSDLLAMVAKGEDKPIKIHAGAGMVLVVVAKPFPTDAHLDSAATSIGEKLWILKDGKPIKDFDDEMLKHIHLENFKKEDGEFKVATANGYMLTTTGRDGKTIKEVREKLIEYTKASIYLPDMKIRHDIGQRVEDYYSKKN
jgi:phosphoribosylamine-glycine ligase